MKEPYSVRMFSIGRECEMDMTLEIGGDEIESQEETKENEHDHRPHETMAGGPDLPPEYCHYRDEGCEYAGSCLACPFPQCLYDEPRGRQRWLKGRRNKEINRLFSSGWKIKELAMLFGVSHRTIQRAVKGWFKETPNARNKKTAEQVETE